MTETDLSRADSRRTVDLLSRASVGDQNAWAELYERYRPLLMFQLQLRMRDSAPRGFDAEDVMQSAWFKAWRNLDSFEDRGEGSFRAWLVRIATRTFLDELRRRDREHNDERIESQSFAAHDQGPRPSEIAMAFERDARLRLALLRLPERYRDIICMRDFERLPVSDIARIAGITESAASSRYARAIGALKKHRQQIGSDDDIEL